MKQPDAARAEFCVHLRELHRNPGERSARALARSAERVRDRAAELGMRLDPAP